MVISTRAHVGSDGIVTIRVPDQMRDTDVAITLDTIADESSDPWAAVPRDAKGWPIGFVEATYGAWQGEPLQRGPQGDFEVRDRLF